MAAAAEKRTRSVAMADTPQRPSPKMHPLQHSWTFWFDSPTTKHKKQRDTNWGDSICPIHTFSTIEDFWRLYNNIRHPSKLEVGADIHCFKVKIEPKWEDPVCANGGKWTVTCARGEADKLWLYTFDHGDEICGAVVGVRGKLERVAIWTRNGLDEHVQMSIGRQWKELLGYTGEIPFVLHDTARKFDRNAESTYSV